MSEQNAAPSTGPTRQNKGPKPAAEKQRAVAFVNWSIPHPTKPGETLLRSSKGFPIYDNDFMTREEKALWGLAVANDGQAKVACEFRIIVAAEKPGDVDISSIPLLP